MNADAPIGDLLGHPLTVTIVTTALVVDLNAESAVAGVTVAVAVMITVRAGGNDAPLITLGDELGAPNSAVLLPCDLGRGTTGTIQTHTLGSGRNINDGPVLGDTVVRLTHLAPRVDLGRDVPSLIVKVNVRRSLGVSTTAAAARNTAVTLNVNMEASGIGVDQEIVIISVSGRAALLRTATALGGVSMDVNFGVLARGVDVDLGLGKLGLLATNRGGRAGWWAHGDHALYVSVLCKLNLLYGLRK